MANAEARATSPHFVQPSFGESYSWNGEDFKPEVPAHIIPCNKLAPYAPLGLWSDDQSIDIWPEPPTPLWQRDQCSGMWVPNGKDDFNVQPTILDFSETTDTGSLKSFEESNDSDGWSGRSAPFIRSTGSMGHPETCKGKCWFLTLPSGCRNGQNCGHCHMPDCRKRATRRANPGQERRNPGSEGRLKKREAMSLYAHAVYLSL